MKKLLKLSLSLVMGVSLISTGIALATQKVEANPAEAASHPGAYNDYTYSGHYYDTIDFSASEGLNGNLRKSLSSLILPKSWPVYSSGGTNHLAELCQEADADPNNSANMIYFYTRDSVKKNAASTWNREHVWPQSLSGGNWGTSYGGTDLLHLRPTYNSTNSKRGNDKYGNVSGSWVAYNGIDYCKSGSGYFEPLDSVKGDCARIIMYVWTAYKDYYSNMPEITNVFQSYDVMMQWHLMDPPDELEGVRNDFCVTSLQKNRNPFVDHPELGWKIYGEKCSSSVLAQAKATYPEGGVKELTSLTYSGTPTKKTYLEGEAFNPTGLTVTATYDDNSTEDVTSKVTWTPAQLSAGTTSVTGTFKSKTITVSGLTVNPATVTGITVSGYKTSFKTGSAFEFNGTVTAALDNGLTKDVTSQATFSGYNMSLAGIQTVTVSYSGKSTSYSITVSDSSLSNDYTLYSGSITEGSYVVLGNADTAAKNAMNGTRIGYDTVTVENDTISDPDTSLVWEIEKSGDYWTIYNEDNDVYMASTGSKSAANLVDSSSDDKALWSITGTSSYEFVNKANKAAGVNANLRLNGTYGFAAYATGTGSPLKLYKAEGSSVNVPVTGINLDKTMVSIEKGKNATVTASVLPANATNQKVIWTTGNSAIATVTNGVIYGVAAGTTTITATTDDGGFTKTVAVAVSEPAIVLNNITITNQVTTYTQGDTFVKPTVTANYSDGTHTDVTSEATFTGYNMANTGTQTVTVSYGGKTATYTITVKAPVVLSSISVSGQKTDYKVGDTFVKPTVTANYSDGTHTDVTSEATFTGYDMSTEGSQTVTVSYSGKTTTYAISVTNGGSSSGSDYSIIFTKNSTDSSTAIADVEGLKGQTSEGADYITSASAISKVYPGKSGLKLGSGSAIGSFTITLATEGQINVKGIEVGCTKYGTDTGKIEVTTNLSSKTSYTPTATESKLEIALTGKLTTITIATSAKRAYVSYINVLAGSGEKVDVEGVTLNQTSKTMTEGTSYTLVSTITPSDASDKTVTWSSNNEAVATVANGVVTAVSAGVATITVTTKDGNFTATCIITVEAAIPGHGTTIDDPLTVAEAIALTKDGDTSVYYIKGIVTDIVTEWSESYKNVTWDIKDETTDDEAFRCYRTTTADKVNPNIVAGDDIIVKGTLKYYGTICEIDAGGTLESVTTVVEKAIAFAQSFNNAKVCGTNDNTAASASIWSTVKASYLALDVFTKEYVKTYNVSTGDNADLTEALTRYDQVVSKRGFEDFMARNPAAASNTISENNNSVIVLLTSISLISLLAVGLLSYRKKKLD